MTPWLDLLRAECERIGQRRVAPILGISQTTISLVLKGKYMHRTDRIEARVRERLDDTPWLRALREEVARTSQARTAERLGISEATVSQVLSGTYKANTLRIERRARGELLGETCECPAAPFELTLRTCQDWQERRGSSSNPMVVQAFAACRGFGRFEKRGPCPHFNGAGAAKGTTKESAS